MYKFIITVSQMFFLASKIVHWKNGSSIQINERNAQHAEEHMQPELFQHFHSEKHNGFLQDYSIIWLIKQIIQILQDRKGIGVSCLKQWLLIGQIW